MKVLTVNGSPRKDGNTAAVLNALEKIAKKSGAKVKRVDLVDLTFSDCRECMGCKKGTKCITDDDMQGIYDAMHDSDIIMIGSPIFMDSETGLTKSFIDRTFGLLAPGKGSEPFETRLEKGKKALVVFTCGMSDGDVVYHGLTVRYFDTFVKLLGYSDFRSFIIPVPSDDKNLLRTPTAKTMVEEASRFLS